MGIVYYATIWSGSKSDEPEYCRGRGFSYLDYGREDDAFLVVAESYSAIKHRRITTTSY